MTPSVISFPSVAAPSTVDWQLQRLDGRFISPLSGTFQDIVRPGARWLCKLTWQRLSYSDARALEAWLAQMSQGGVRTALPNYAYTLQGSGAGSPVVGGSGQTGNILNIRGFTSGANLLIPGDMIGISTASQHQLLMVTSHVGVNSYPAAQRNTTYALDDYVLDTNGNRQTCVIAGTTGASAPTWSTVFNATTTDGSVTWQLSYITYTYITPALRISPADGAAVQLSAPTAYFALAKQGYSLTYSAPRIGALSVSLIEDILL